MAVKISGERKNELYQLALEISQRLT